MQQRIPTPNRVYRLALASRIAPVVVLALGLLVWTQAMPKASGQYQGGGNFAPPSGAAFGGPQSVPGGTTFASGATQGNNAVRGNNAMQRNGAIGGNNYPAAGGGIYGAAAQPAARIANANTAVVSMIPAIAGGMNDGGIDGQTPDEAGSRAFEWPPIVDKILRGGWLMVPLGICSLLVLSLSMERLISLRRGRVIPRPFVRRFTECVEDGQLSYDEATEICEEFDCPVAEVFRAAVRRWGRPMLEIEQAVIDAGDRVGDSLKRFVRVFHAISNVAPLLGLLGTVLGMIEAFEMISNEESMGRPDMLASGISMALVTTAAGLSVAIPAYLAYMYFNSKSDRYLVEIDKLCAKVIDSISAEALENGSRRKKRAA